MKEYKLSSRSGKLLLREEIDTKISTLKIGGPSVNTNTADSNINIDKAPSGSSSASGSPGSSGSSGSTPPPANGTIPPGDSTDPGTSGFGVGVAPTKWVNEYGLTPMEGYNIPGHENYGNYTDHTGSVMIWIPRHFVKFSHVKEEPYLGTRIDVSKTLQNGYTLPRCFINTGVMLDGLFIDKYKGSLENNVLVSKRNKNPAYIGPGRNSIGLIPNIVTQVDNVYKVVKTRGPKYSVPTIFLWTHLANLADNHYQSAYRQNKPDICAWGDVEPRQPKGCLLNCKDPNDSTVQYNRSDENAAWGKTGSVSDNVFAKITHNGQKSGVTDVNGLLQEVGSGLFISQANVKSMVLKESVDVKDITPEIIGRSEYFHEFSLRIQLDGTESFFGDGNSAQRMPFTNTFKIKHNDYINDSCGIPKETSSIPVKRYGKDKIWKRATDNMLPTVGSSYEMGEIGGIRTRMFRANRTETRPFVGVRCALVPSTGQPIPASLLGGGEVTEPAPEPTLPTDLIFTPTLKKVENNLVVETSVEPVPKHTKTEWVVKATNAGADIVDQQVLVESRDNTADKYAHTFENYFNNFKHWLVNPKAEVQFKNDTEHTAWQSSEPLNVKFEPILTNVEIEAIVQSGSLHLSVTNKEPIKFKKIGTDSYYTMEEMVDYFKKNYSIQIELYDDSNNATQPNGTTDKFTTQSRIDILDLFTKANYNTILPIQQPMTQDPLTSATANDKKLYYGKNYRVKIKFAVGKDEYEENVKIENTYPIADGTIKLITLPDAPARTLRTKMTTMSTTYSTSYSTSSSTSHYTSDSHYTTGSYHTSYSTSYSTSTTISRVTTVATVTRVPYHVYIDLLNIMDVPMVKTFYTSKTIYENISKTTSHSTSHSTTYGYNTEVTYSTSYSTSKNTSHNTSTTTEYSTSWYE